MQNDLHGVNLDLAVLLFVKLEGNLTKQFNGSLHWAIQSSLEVECLRGIHGFSSRGICAAAADGHIGSQHATSLDAREEALLTYDCADNYAMRFSEATLKIFCEEENPDYYWKIEEVHLVTPDCIQLILPLATTTQYKTSNLRKKTRRSRRLKTFRPMTGFLGADHSVLNVLHH